MREVFHPGEILCEWWLNGMSVDRAAKRIGVSSRNLGHVLSGRSGITAELAQKLEAAGWAQAKFWMWLQIRYEQSQEKLKQNHKAA